MTEFPGLHIGAAEREDAVRSGPDSDLPMTALRPLMEGARARGVADACELLGVAAVLLDRAGEVLHLTSSASGFMGGAIRVAGGHLVAVDPAANQIIERIIGAALSGARAEDRIDSPHAAPLALRALPFPGAREDEAQLLKAVLIVDSIETARRDSRAA